MNQTLLNQVKNRNSNSDTIELSSEALEMLRKHKVNKEEQTTTQ